MEQEKSTQEFKRPEYAPRHDREKGESYRYRKPQMPFFKKKFCGFCTGQYKPLSYKSIDFIRRFVSEQGKILPRRVTGTCAKHQRKVALEVKRARILALLPYIGK